MNDLKDQQIAQNTNSNELLKSDCVLIFLINEYLKNEFFKAEAAKISQSAINRELGKLFSWTKKQVSTLKPSPGKCPLRAFLTISKNTSIQQILLIQLLQTNLVVIFQNLLVSCKLSQTNFWLIMKYQPLVRFRNIFANQSQRKLVTMLMLSY